MKIVLHQEAPPALVSIIDQAYTDIISINAVELGIDFIPLREKQAVGAFDPASGTVFIDMQNCLRDRRWMDKGCLYIPSVWFNLMYATHHELIHAVQVVDDPSLIDMDVVPKDKEDEAHYMAMDAMFSWFEAGGKIPPLGEMGWVGEAIASTLNGLFSRMPEAVIEELDMMKMGAVARAEAVTSAHDHFNDSSILYENIDKGEIGIKFNGKRYLTASELLAI